MGKAVFMYSQEEILQPFFSASHKATTLTEDPMGVPQPPKQHPITRAHHMSCELTSGGREAWTRATTGIIIASSGDTVGKRVVGTDGLVVATLRLK